MLRSSRSALPRLAAVTVVFAYLLLLGGTLNGLAVYGAVSLSLSLLALVGAAWLGWAWVSGEPVAFSPVAVAYSANVAAYGAAAALSLDPRRSLNALCLTTLYALVWVLVSDLISKGWPAELFTRVMAVVGSIVVGLALWQTASYQLDWLAISAGEAAFPPVVVRPHPLLGHANMVAVFLNLLWPIVLVRLFSSTSWINRILGSLWVLLAWAVILLASSRSAWLGAATALPVTLGLWWLAEGGRAGRRLRIPRPSGRWLAVGAGVLPVVAAAGLAAVWLFQRSALRGFGLGARQIYWETAWRTFLDHPVAGLGPDTFPTAYQSAVSIPPHIFYVHAHSKPFHLLAENGLLGIVSGAALLVTALWAAWRHWRGETVPQRRFLAGVAGALITIAVHCLFDTPSESPLNAIVAAVLLAILATQPHAVALHRRGGWRWRLALTVCLLALLGVGAWSQVAYRPYLEGAALANAGHWEAAVPRLEAAVARDPGHALYSLASGYVHGVLAAQGDVASAGDGTSPAGMALDTAIRRYEGAIEREPGYGLNHANLAALYWQRGDAAAALAAAQRAVEAAPREATFWLNLGFYRDETGDLAGAQGAYERTLDLRPRWASAYYWRATDLRQAVLEAWRAARSSQEPQGVSAKAQHALAEGQYEEAVALFDEALAARPQWPSGYAGRAEASLTLGRYEEAARDARIAAFIGSLEPSAIPHSDWVLARIAYEEGDIAVALTLGERALEGYRRQSIFGPGTWGGTVEAWGPVYHRVGLTDDMLPQLVTIRFTDREIGWLVTLGAWYEEAGDTEAAGRVYEEALDAAPDASIAAERLAGLDGG
jgi:tetratricopeptide (TPR) repeat protein/O-antigen ligase